jgi:hypothetical protein
VLRYTPQDVWPELRADAHVLLAAMDYLAWEATHDLSALRAAFRSLAPLLAVGRETLERAFRRRHYHHGYMGNYQVARRLVQEASEGRHPLLASWLQQLTWVEGRQPGLPARPCWDPGAADG